MNIYLLAVISFIITLLITYIIGKTMIPMLKGEKGHKIFDLAPKSHQKKTGTPSFGGFIFIIPFIILGLIMPLFIDIHQGNYQYVLVTVIATAGFGIVGFIDDFIKYKKKDNDGFSFLWKFIAQVIIALISVLILSNYNILNTTVTLFIWKINLNIIVYFIFLVFYLSAFANATNFTDGLDGLLGTNALVTTLTFIVISLWANESSLALIDMIFAFSLVGFLYFNWYPAKIFMGDTGSLAIGGFLAMNAIVLKVEILFVIFGLVYIFETLSVTIQMLYFKYTKKKTGQGVRIFPMTPIHHSFEKALDWKEVKIVKWFTTTTLLLSVISLFLYTIGVR